ncbi:MAG: tetratricopeptide repeat protein [Actinomycetota bacterium]|nr:tetratricopeptide repeat protein [Actinomycetota bacterium]
MEDNSYALFQKGMGLLEDKHPAQAALVLEKVKVIHPEKASIREALGRAYFNHGQYRLAKEEFLKAVEIEPTNDYAHFGLGLSFKKMGDRRMARRHLKLAAIMKPDDKYILALVGLSV